MQNELECVENDTLSSVVGKLLKKRKESISVAESCTGGLLSSMLVSSSGASSYYLGGIVSYNNSIKIKQLKVSEDILDEKGAVSEEVADLMAKGVCEEFSSDWSLSTTGVAGPTGAKDLKPVGLVYIGICYKGETKLIHECRWAGEKTREQIQQLSCKMALELLRRELLKD